MIGGELKMSRKKITVQGILIIFLIIIFFLFLLCCLYFQEKRTCEIIVGIFSIWMIKNIFRFVAWITE